MRKGMNPEDVEKMAGHLEEAGQKVKTHFKQAHDALEHLQWTGEDRDKFLSSFSQDLQHQVNDLATKVHELSATAKRNAQEQRTTSSH